MVIELCRCGWNIPGVDELPAHQHVTRRRIRRDDGFEFAMGGHWIEQDGYTVLEQHEELAIAVPWKGFARALALG